jgi:hypothetical protein
MEGIISAFICFVIVLVFVKIAFHAICQFRGERALNFAAAQCSGNARAMFAVVRICRTNAEFCRFYASFFPTALFKFPTIHNIFLPLAFLQNNMREE